MHRSWIVGLTLLLLSTAPTLAAGLTAPDTATIGSKVEVTWDAPGNQYDAVFIIAPDAPDDAKGMNAASITSGKNPVVVVMPDEPGNWELRYRDRTQKTIVARRPIQVVEVPTSLTAPDEAVIGATLDVEWQGPGNTYERIVVTAPDAPDDAKPVAHVSIHGKSPVQVRLPETPGSYELRYITRQSKRVLARRPLVVRDVDAGLTAPDQAAIGEKIEITWQGPGNQYDQVALYAADAEEGARPVVSVGIASRRNPVVMKVPEDAGAYELRYVTRQDKRVLATRPLTVGNVDVSLTAPDRTAAGRPLEVHWTGPGNNYDHIGLYAVGAADDAKPVAATSILSRRNPVTIKVPDVEGPHELRYRTTQQRKVLARRAVEVEPTGRLAVVFEREGTVTDGASTGDAIGAVELILDASGSMLQRENGVRRIEIARQVLDEIIRQHLPDGRGFALRVFGHKEADSCRTDLEIPFGPLDRNAAATRVASVQAMNLAKTPIAASLAKVASDLSAAKGPKTVILITDGEETCGGDPTAAIRALKAHDINAQLSIVGFAIDDDALRADFETWAQLGGGSYFDARSADELTRSLRTVISGPFRVLNADGAVVGQGVIGGAPVVLPAGTYTVEAVGSTTRVEGVVVKPREDVKVQF